MSRFARHCGAVLVVTLALYGAVCGYMWVYQTELVFEPEAALQTTPDRLGMQFDELRITVGRGSERGELYGWWIPSVQADAPTMLYFHGNNRNIANHLEHTLHLHSLGYNVLLVDYRGYGKSGGGRPSEAKVYEDAEAAWQYLLRQRGVKPQQVFIYGHSLGGAVAVDLALRHPEAAGVIAESTFTSMQAMGELEYGYLPVGWLLNQRFDSLQKLPGLKIPLLLIHGSWDKKVPVEMARQLYAAAPQPKTLILIEGGEHSDSSTIGRVEYRAAVSAFVKNHAH